MDKWIVSLSLRIPLKLYRKLKFIVEKRGTNLQQLVTDFLQKATDEFQNLKGNSMNKWAMASFSIRLPLPLYRNLKFIAEEHDINLHQLVTDFLQEATNNFTLDQECDKNGL